MPAAELLALVCDTALLVCVDSPPELMGRDVVVVVGWRAEAAEGG